MSSIEKDSSTDRLDMVLQTFDRLKTMKRDSPTAYRMLLSTLKKWETKASTLRAIEELEWVIDLLITGDVHFPHSQVAIEERLDQLKKGLK